MSIKLKICGMRDSANIKEVAALKPDCMGFIFYNKSPRYVGDNFELPQLPDSIKRVGVFVNEQAGLILDHVRKHNLDFVQLHGDESIDLCKELKNAGIEIIKAFSVDEDFNFHKLDPFRNYVRYVLFDTKGKYYGGNSKTFDWTLLQKYDQSIPFFLSGGISVENITGLKNLSEMNIHAIDVNSGVEVFPAFKDVQKIKQVQQTINVL